MDNYSFFLNDGEDQFSDVEEIKRGDVESKKLGETLTEFFYATEVDKKEKCLKEFLALVLYKNPFEGSKKLTSVAFGYYSNEEGDGLYNSDTDRIMINTNSTEFRGSLKNRNNLYYILITANHEFRHHLQKTNKFLGLKLSLKENVLSLCSSTRVKQFLKCFFEGEEALDNYVYLSAQDERDARANQLDYSLKIFEILRGEIKDKIILEWLTSQEEKMKEYQFEDYEDNIDILMEREIDENLWADDFLGRVKDWADDKLTDKEKEDFKVLIDIYGTADLKSRKKIEKILIKQITKNNDVELADILGMNSEFFGMWFSDKAKSVIIETLIENNKLQSADKLLNVGLWPKRLKEEPDILDDCLSSSIIFGAAKKFVEKVYETNNEGKSEFLKTLSEYDDYGDPKLAKKVNKRLGLDELRSKHREEK